jgi:cytochrome c2
MGMNATVVVMHDALGQIESDPRFGAKLAEAIRTASVVPDARQDVTAGNHMNAAHVVECHHADTSVTITVGENLGKVRSRAYAKHTTEEGQLRLVEIWADKLGYRLVAK